QACLRRVPPALPRALDEGTPVLGGGPPLREPGRAGGRWSDLEPSPDRSGRRQPGAFSRLARSRAGCYHPRRGAPRPPPRLTPPPTRRSMELAPTDADRNLLFGVLALQDRSVARDDLIAGMIDWAEDRSRPLGQVLVARGGLEA